MEGMGRMREGKLWLVGKLNEKLLNTITKPDVMIMRGRRGQ